MKRHDTKMRGTKMRDGRSERGLGELSAVRMEWGMLHEAEIC